MENESKKKNHNIFIIIGIVLIVFAAVLLICYYSSGDANNLEKYAAVDTAESQCPLDIEKLTAENPDVCGVLEITGTDIIYPVLQSEDDSLYLDHNWKKEKDRNGALFTESEYNSRFFTDPVTVIYGHHMKSGMMFGDLQKIYSDKESFDAHKEMRVYTPNGTFVYRVVAALPYSNSHILYYNDFSDSLSKAVFFNDIFSVRDLNANFDYEGFNPEGGEVIILSTCLSGNNNNRYIVIAQRV